MNNREEIWKEELSVLNEKLDNATTTLIDLSSGEDWFKWMEEMCKWCKKWKNYHRKMDRYLFANEEGRRKKFPKLVENYEKDFSIFLDAEKDYFKTQMVYAIIWDDITALRKQIEDIEIKARK